MAIQNPRILFIIPPLTQLNTAHPATAYLKGFLKQMHYEVWQADLSIELILQLFSKTGLTELFNKIEGSPESQWPSNVERIIRLKHEYLSTIDRVVLFLQNKDTTLAYHIATGNFLPQASRFSQAEDLEWAFGTMGISDKAKFLATLYLEDIADLITATVAPYFQFGRYAEQLGIAAASFQPIEDELNKDNNLVDQNLVELLEAHIQSINPDVIGFSIPFHGNLYGALKCCQHIKKNHPLIRIILGGSYVNTELRQLQEPKIFDYTDFICLDDGEIPVLCIIEHLERKRTIKELVRTYIINNGKVKYMAGPGEGILPHEEAAVPDYTGLHHDQYLSVMEMYNPMVRLWTDGHWNKLTLAHGCYWHKCAFCDTSLDYIKRYSPAKAETSVNHIEQIIQQTGQTGFHFVDEAAPPSLLKEIAIEILKRKLVINWWTNIRFEKNFTSDLCRLLAKSGCIAISGGLEVADNRLLQKMNKGITIEQAAITCKNFTDAGIMVHAYLMFGFPTQTELETINSLETVRQFFENEILQSGHWHRFIASAHSPVGQNPADFDIEILTDSGVFANNDYIHNDPTGCDHEQYSEGLKKALYNYMLGMGIDWPLNDWFDFEIQGTTLPVNLISKYIQKHEPDKDKLGMKAIWTSPLPEIRFYEAQKKGKRVQRTKVTFFEKAKNEELFCSQNEGKWLETLIHDTRIENVTYPTFEAITESYTAFTGQNISFLVGSALWETLRSNGLVLL